MNDDVLVSERQKSKRKDMNITSNGTITSLQESPRVQPYTGGPW